MINSKTFFLSFLFLFFWSNSFTQSLPLCYNDNQTQPNISIDNSVELNSDINIDDESPSSDSTLRPSSSSHRKAIIDYPPSSRDFRKLTLNTSLYFGAAAVIFGVLYLCPENVSGWDKKDMKNNGISRKWEQNVKSGPIMDQDNFFFNYVTHPYAGGVYYMTARSSGFNRLESFLYSTVMSTLFWEYGIEAFAEVPSYQDIVVTPIIGSVVGEGFYFAKKEILRHNSKILRSKLLGVSTLFFMDPFNTILDGLGYKQKVKAQLSMSPVGYHKQSNHAIWGLQFSANF